METRPEAAALRNYRLSREQQERSTQLANLEFHSVALQMTNQGLQNQLLGVHPGDTCRYFVKVLPSLQRRVTKCREDGAESETAFLSTRSGKNTTPLIVWPKDRPSGSIPFWLPPYATNSRSPSWHPPKSRELLGSGPKIRRQTSETIESGVGRELLAEGPSEPCQVPPQQARLGHRNQSARPGNLYGSKC